MKKRIVSLLLVFVMVLGMFPVDDMASGEEYVYLSMPWLSECGLLKNEDE